MSLRWDKSNSFCDAFKINKYVNTIAVRLGHQTWDTSALLTVCARVFGLSLFIFSGEGREIESLDKIKQHPKRYLAVSKAKHQHNNRKRAHQTMTMMLFLFWLASILQNECDYTLTTSTQRRIFFFTYMWWWQIIHSRIAASCESHLPHIDSNCSRHSHRMLVESFFILDFKLYNRIISIIIIVEPTVPHTHTHTIRVHESVSILCLYIVCLMSMSMSMFNKIISQNLIAH